MANPMCSFYGHEAAIVRVRLSAGCAARPNDREQDLCAQHLVKMNPIGDVETVIVYNQKLLDWVNGHAD